MAPPPSPPSSTSTPAPAAARPAPSARPRRPRLRRRIKLAIAPYLIPAIARLARRFTRLERDFRDTDVKMACEMQYWRWLVKRGGSEKTHGGSFRDIFGGWQRERMVHLAAALGLPRDGAIGDWCAQRSVVEIGAGPYPSAAAAPKGWKRAVAVDPLGKRYTEEGLLPPEADRIIYLDSPGEAIPLPAGFADIVICENCLDHVERPEAVVDEAVRLLKPGGYFWFFVDLSNHRDHMHPHSMNEQRVRELLARFEMVFEKVSQHKAHPKAYGSFRCLCRKPTPAAPPSPRAPAATSAGAPVAAEPKPTTAPAAAGASREHAPTR